MFHGENMIKGNSGGSRQTDKSINVEVPCENILRNVEFVSMLKGEVRI
jgi:hypothetical protein